MKTTLNIASLLLLFLMIIQYAQADNGFQATANGVLYKDLVTGTGKTVQSGDVVTMHFIGWLDNSGSKGREIYNTRKEHQPVSFVVGTDKVMQGWSEGVIGMRTGGKRLLHVPPALGYGTRSIEDVIPAGASLIFVIDLIDVEKKPQ